MRRYIAWVHRYLGLALGTVLLVSGLSGSALVFRSDVDTFLNPDLLSIQASAERVSIDTVLSQAGQAVPGKAASLVFLSEMPTRPTEVWFRNSTEQVYINPYTGDVVGVRHATDSLMGFLADLHIHLLSGETGERIMGWAGVGAILLSFLGMWLWWPRPGRWKQALSIKWQAAPIRVWLDVHNVAGAVMFAFLIMTTATGVSLALYDFITEPLLIALTGEGARNPAPASTPGRNGNAEAKAPLAPMLQQASALFPDGRITRLSLPAKPLGAIGVRMRLEGEIHQFGRTFLWFDQYDGKLLRVDNVRTANLATRIQNWLFPLHTGVYGGLPTRWLQVLVGLSLSLLTLSGAWLWWKAFRARSIASQRRSRSSRQPTAAQ